MRDRSDRLRLLASAIPDRGAVRLADAAGLLGCSTMTVRRDVASAPERFALLGGHVVLAASAKTYDLDREAAANAGAKEAVCARAARMLGEGEMIFIDCGTTTAHLARRLPLDMRLTVVCYALNVAESLAANPNVQLILLGGRFNASSASFEVADPRASPARLGVAKAFISAGGVHAVRGVTCSKFHEVAVKQAAMEVALESHLLIDASKLGKVQPAAFATLDQFDSVIVSPGPEPGPERERLGERLILA